MAELLITGFPGLRARAIVASLREHERDRPIAVVVHPARRSDAEAALRALPNDAGLRVLWGDPAAIDFGLARAPYRELCERVRVVHHAYQVLDLGAPADVASTLNVGGAREIIEFSKVAARLERVVHYSSVFVSGDRSGLVLEHELARGQKFRTPVEESLALAEQMLARGLKAPLSVLRTPLVVGDSRTGDVDRLDGIYPLLVFLASAQRGLTLPLPPRANAPLYLVPVDYVARAGRAVAGEPRAAGKTLHLVDPAAPSVRHFLELVAARFGQRFEPGLNAAAFGRALLKNPGVGLLARKLRVLVDLLGAHVTYDSRNAQELLSAAGVACPPLEAYLEPLLAHVERRVAERRLAEADAVEGFHVAG